MIISSSAPVRSTRAASSSTARSAVVATWVPGTRAKKSAAGGRVQRGELARGVLGGDDRPERPPGAQRQGHDAAGARQVVRLVVGVGDEHGRRDHEPRGVEHGRRPERAAVGVGGLQRVAGVEVVGVAERQAERPGQLGAERAGARAARPAGSRSPTGSRTAGWPAATGRGRAAAARAGRGRRSPRPGSRRHPGPRPCAAGRPRSSGRRRVRGRCRGRCGRGAAPRASRTARRRRASGGWAA